MRRWNLAYCVDVNRAAGCSKRPQFSLSQPRRAKTRRSSSKAAVSEEARRYAPHFVRLFARRIDLGEQKSPSSASEPLSDARTLLADFFSILLEPLFLEIIHVEPHIDRAMVRHELGNVLLQVLLGLETHVAEPGIAHGVIPLQDHIRVLDL